MLKNTFTDKRILITGATGLIGSNLVDRLMCLGVSQLIVTGRNKAKLIKTFAEYIDNPCFMVIEHDASDSFPPKIKDLDFIFHAAGPMERDIVMNKPVSVILPNITGTINCLEFLKNQQISTGKKGRLIVFSSVTVYANPTNEDYTAVENDTTHAISLDQPYACYAESKRMAEVIAQSYKRQYDVDIVIARFSTVYGYCKNIPDTAFFEFIKKAIAGETITINGSGIPRRDNIYVDDAVDGVLTIAAEGETGEAYNISSNGDLDNFAAIDEIAGLIAKLTAEKFGKKNINLIIPDNKLRRKPGLLLNNEKLKNLGWKLIYSHNEGIIKTISKII